MVMDFYEDRDWEGEMGLKAKPKGLLIQWEAEMEGTMEVLRWTVEDEEIQVRSPAGRLAGFTQALHFRVVAHATLLLVGRRSW